MRKILIAIIIILVLPFYTRAESYDFYVDRSADSFGNGSKEKPFETISEALEESEEQGGGKKIYVGKGNYSESFTLGKSTELYGKSREDIIIRGKIIMKDDSLIKNVTLNGSLSGIVVQSGSQVKITNCEIKNFGKMGIDVLPGKGKVVLTNSRLHHGTGKAIYVQAGRSVDIENNNIYSNGEEGVDIRENVSGIVSNNNIYSNGEGGIEIVLGKADVKITGNTIQKNHANGIATQFYKQFSQLGNVTIENNVIGGNKKYGIDCMLTFKSDPPEGYWKSSMHLTNNNFNNNGLGIINSFCKITQASPAEEKKEEPISTTEQISPPPEVIENREVLNAEVISQSEEVTIKPDPDIEKVEKVAMQVETIEKEIDQAILKLAQDQNSIKRFFWGVDLLVSRQIENKLKDSQEKIKQMKNMLVDLERQEDRILEENLISEKEKIVFEQEKLLNRYKNRFSLLGWLVAWWYR